MHFLIRETLSFNLMYVTPCYSVGTTISKTSSLFTAFLQHYWYCVNKISKMFKPSSNFLAVPRRCFFLWIDFVTCVSCHTVLSVPYSLVVTCWERAHRLALLYVTFFCLFVTFPYGILGQVWKLIV